jgi:hypothetical protein
MTEPVSEFKPGDRVIVRGTLVEVGNPRPSPWLYFSPDKDHVEWSVLPASVEPEPYVPTVGERVVSVRADQYVGEVIEVGPTVKVRWRPGGSVTSPRVVNLRPAPPEVDPDAELREASQVLVDLYCKSGTYAQLDSGTWPYRAEFGTALKRFRAAVEAEKAQP